MSKIHVTRVEIKPAQPAVFEETIFLELSKDEAQFLIDVLGAVGGSPLSSRRKHSKDIIQSLSNAGFKYRCTDFTGTLMFS
jgi:hypothetical protein